MRIQNAEDFVTGICDTRKMNRVPFIVSTKEAKFDKASILARIDQIMEKESYEIDLRAKYQESKSVGRDPVKETLYGEVKEAFMGKKVIFLNMDETAEEFKELYVPNIKEFYGSRGFPSQFWHPEEFVQASNLETLDYWQGPVSDENPFDIVLEDFNFMVWSKLKLDADISEDDKLIKSFETQFLSAGGSSSSIKQRVSSSVPMDRINLLLVNGLDDKQEELSLIHI